MTYYEDAIARLKKINLNSNEMLNKKSCIYLFSEFRNRVINFLKDINYKEEVTIRHSFFVNRYLEVGDIDLDKIDSNLSQYQINVNSFVSKINILAYLVLNILADRGNMYALNHIEMFEPIIVLLERGGYLNTHHGDLQVNGMLVNSRLSFNTSVYKINIDQEHLKYYDEEEKIKYLKERASTFELAYDYANDRISKIKLKNNNLLNNYEIQELLKKYSEYARLKFNYEFSLEYPNICPDVKIIPSYEEVYQKNIDDIILYAQKSSSILNRFMEFPTIFYILTNYIQVMVGFDKYKYANRYLYYYDPLLILIENGCIIDQINNSLFVKNDNYCCKLTIKGDIINL